MTLNMILYAILTVLPIPKASSHNLHFASSALNRGPLLFSATVFTAHLLTVELAPQCKERYSAFVILIRYLNTQSTFTVIGIFLAQRVKHYAEASCLFMWLVSLKIASKLCIHQKSHWLSRYGYSKMPNEWNTERRYANAKSICTHIIIT